MATKQEYRMR